MSRYLFYRLLLCMTLPLLVVGCKDKECSCVCDCRTNEAAIEESATPYETSAHQDGVAIDASAAARHASREHPESPGGDDESPLGDAASTEQAAENLQADTAIKPKPLRLVAAQRIGSDLRHAEAKAHCAKLNESNHSGWKLPDANETRVITGGDVWLQDGRFLNSAGKPQRPLGPVRKRAVCVARLRL